MSILGTRVVRTEDPRLLTAGGIYTDDLRLPELDGAARVDVRAQPDRARPDHRHRRRGGPGVARGGRGADRGRHRRPARAAATSRPPSRCWPADRVRYVGEAVAIVLTEDGYQGEDAAELVSVDYEPLPAVVGISTTRWRGDTLLFDGTDSNVAGTGGSRAVRRGRSAAVTS